MIQNLGSYLYELRTERKLPLRIVGVAIEVDGSLIGKMEKNQYIPSKQQVERLADFFQVDKQEMLIALLTEKTLKYVKKEPYAYEALKRAEARLREEQNAKRKDSTAKSRKERSDS